MRKATDEAEILKEASRILSERLQRRTIAVEQMRSAIDCIDKEIGAETDRSSQPFELESHSLRIPRDLFFGMRLSTAVQKYLQMRGEAVDGHEILRDLKSGGFAEDSLGSGEDTQLANLKLALGKNTKTFQRLPNGAFGLLVWYGDRIGTTRHKRRRKKRDAESTVSSNKATAE